MAGKTALVLSAGGMFASYQAGAWLALEDVFHPDVVVGASAGALNAWAIAGGCTGKELARRWRNLGAAGECRWKFPDGPLAGIIDTSPIEETIGSLYASFRPKTEIGIVITDLKKLRPELVTGAAITARHLAASCAVLGIFPQPRIGGRVYTDGGLLGAVPLWAAAAMGASRAVVVDALPVLPLAPARLLVRAIRGLSRFQPPATDFSELVRISPGGPLGGVRDAVRWDAANARRWIGCGRRDAERAAVPGGRR